MNADKRAAYYRTVSKQAASYLAGYESAVSEQVAELVSQTETYLRGNAGCDESCSDQCGLWAVEDQS
jgi:hypothetical protein